MSTGGGGCCCDCWEVDREKSHGGGMGGGRGKSSDVLLKYRVRKEDGSGFEVRETQWQLKVWKECQQRAERGCRCSCDLSVSVNVWSVCE